MQKKIRSLTSFFYNNETRAILFQVLALAIIFYFFYQTTSNLFDNIASRGIQTGFSFLDSEAGFDISEYLIDYSPASSNLTAFYVGIINTILVSIIGIIFATIIGLIIGVSRLSNNWIIKQLSHWYIEIFRNIPILLQILFWYNIFLNILPATRQSFSFFDIFFINLRGFYFPKPIMESGFSWLIIAFIVGFVARYFMKKYFKDRQDKTGIESHTAIYSILLLIGFPVVVYYLMGVPMNFDISELKGFNFNGGISLSVEFLSLVFALSIYTATYIAEAIRSGIESVDKGQKEAAKSLGLTPTQSLKLIILPQAMRVAIPPIINQYLNLAKNSSLATAIGYPDVVAVFTGTVLNNVGQAIEIVLMTMAVYLTISLFISFVLNMINKKTTIKGR